jgi:hypothetical protein
LACGAAVLAWVGAAAGSRSPLLGAVAAAAATVVAALARRRWWAVAGLLVGAAALSGALSAARESAVLEAALPSGRVVVAGVAADDPVPEGDGERFVLRPTHLLGEGGWEAGRRPGWPPASECVSREP